MLINNINLLNTAQAHSSSSNKTGPCNRAKDSKTKALHMGQCWKRDTQLSHTHACLHGSSTRFTGAFWQTTQSLPCRSQRSSRLSSSDSGCSGASLGSVSLCCGSRCSDPWTESDDGPDDSPSSADMNRG